jgi:hypothetical protein
MAIRTSIFITGLVILSALAAPPADAKPHDKQVKHKNKSTVAITIPAIDRGIIFNYLESHRYPHHCPPGLAKKRNGCLPPGIAKKYAIGQSLPPGIGHKVPHGLLTQLHPIAGYQYIQVDQDILLISEATKKVVDAVTLLSAVQ